MRSLATRLLILLLLFWPITIWAAGNESASTQPVTPGGVPTAGFLTDLRNILGGTVAAGGSAVSGCQGEDACRFAEQFPSGMVFSGGIHATAGSCTSPTFATTAYTRAGNRVRNAAAAIDYNTVGCNCADPGSDTAWVIASALSADTSGNFQRVSGTDYFVDCVSTSQPTLPNDSTWLMQVGLVNGTINTVARPRGFCSNPQCLFLSVQDPLYGATGDGVTDDRVNIGRAVTDAGAIGTAVFFPCGTYVTNSASPLVSSTDAEHLLLRGAGVTCTTLRQNGTGDVIDVTVTGGTRPIVHISNMTILGNNTAAKCIDLNQTQHSVVENLNIDGCLNHAIDLRGLNSLKNIVRNVRITAGVGALATGRGVNATGNTQTFEYNYFNLGSNVGRYETALDVIGCGGCLSLHNTFDGVPTAIRSRLAFTSIHDWFDVTSGGVVQITTAYVHDANNRLAIVAPVNISLASHVSFTATDRRYLSFIASNEADRGVFAGVITTAILTPPALGGNVNNYAPTGGADASFWRVDAGGTTRNITGIASGVGGRILYIWNFGTGDLIFTHNDIASTAGNRIEVAGAVNYRLHERAIVSLLYDGTNSVWRIGEERPAFLQGTFALNFAAPGAVPGCVDSAAQSFTGVALGDVASTGVNIAQPSTHTLHGYVNAANTVVVRWCQHSGAAADPDGAGATYTVHIWKLQ